MPLAGRLGVACSRAVPSDDVKGPNADLDASSSSVPLLTGWHRIASTNVPRTSVAKRPGSRRLTPDASIRSPLTRMRPPSFDDYFSFFASPTPSCPFVFVPNLRCSNRNVVPLLWVPTSVCVSCAARTEFRILSHFHSIFQKSGQPRKENVALLASDSAPHIVVGTPGRLLDLAEPFTGRNGRGDGSVALDLSNIKIFIVDECDRVLATEAAGRGMREKVQKIFMKTPKEKQVMMFSATLDKETSKTCELFMQDPLLITLVGREKELVLHGLKQYVAKIPESEKNAKLVDILDDVQFNQAIIFVDSSERAEKLNQMLVEATFPSAALHGHVKSSDGKSNGRAEKFSEFKSYKSRILVTTDLCARGVDVERVNVVINYDFPGDADTYMHRVGRAGRFGTKGMAISFVRSDADEHKANRAEKTEAEVYEEVQNRFKAKLSDLPDSIDPSDYK
eukprot:INCI19150.1.p1 GENE.INCI19150.1~~INCI19150.1.p1  ORF type:complete len:450 (-),score=72.17 INCI19150.1:464-1813(-)